MIPLEDRFSIAPFGLRMPSFFFFPGCCGCGDSCAIFSDDFSADNLASNYTVDSGTWTVSGGTLSATSANAVITHNTAIPADTTAIHCQVTVTCATTSDAGELVFAYTDASNYWYASVIPGATDGTLKILEVSGGTTTQRGVAKKILGFVAGDTITLAVCYSDGLVTAQVGTDIARCYSVTLSVEGTYCGLKTGSDSSSVTLDDFTVSRYGPSGGCPMCLTCTEGDICNICDDEIGVWPTDWPANLYLTITGSCCAALNRTWTLPRSPTFTKYYDSSLTTNIQITGCGGKTISPFGYSSRVEILCDDGAWVARMTLSGGAADPTVPRCATPLILNAPTLLSCVPFHMTGTGQTFDTGPCEQPNTDAFSCSGTFSFEITE